MTDSSPLKAFSAEQLQKAKLHLATQVAHMMGRKMEEGDWTHVYCLSKGIPPTGWSNLNIDVNYEGLGVEHKLLRCSGLDGRSIKTVCGTTMMHPAATRSIRIDRVDAQPNDVMLDVIRQYAELIEVRREKVRAAHPKTEPDMRVGWLIWEDLLVEFLYFEQRLEAPNPDEYYAEWNDTAARGARKASRSLWIFERATNKKRYSVTTSAGIKIQPYFDVPAPSNPDLYYFRVQSEPIGTDTVQIWVSAPTARAIQRILGNLDKESVSKAVIEASAVAKEVQMNAREDLELAQPIQLTMEAFELFQKCWQGRSDEHRAQLFVEALYGLKLG